MSKEPRCKHRHSIRTHPSCFKNGMIRGDNKIKGMNNNYEDPFSWYEESGMKIGYFDIEVAGGLDADFSTMISWATKERGGDVVTDYITKKELFDLEFDRRLVESCVRELSRYKIIVTYYGSGFDIPYIRSKALFYDIDFPGYIAEVHTLKNGDTKLTYDAELIHWDLYYTVSRKLKLSRYSLDNACYYLGIEGKTPLDKKLWMYARYGDPKSVAKVVEHNVGDVKILEELHNRLVPFKKWVQSPA